MPTHCDATTLVDESDHPEALGEPLTRDPVDDRWTVREWLDAG